MTQEESLAERLSRLEELTMHQDYLLQQLNDQVLRLSADWEQSRRRLEKQIAELAASQESQGSPLDPDERPPHY